MGNSINNINFKGTVPQNNNIQESSETRNFGIKAKPSITNDKFEKLPNNMRLQVIEGVSLAAAAAGILSMIKTGKMNADVEKFLLAAGEKLPKGLNQKINLLGEIATRDGMTALKNKRVFISDMSQKIVQGAECKVIQFDLDFFKSINDILGHDIGDVFLKEFAKELGDDAYRIGGEEFTMIVPSDQLDEAVDKIKDIASRYKNNSTVQGYKEEFLEKVTTKIQAAETKLAELFGDESKKGLQKRNAELKSEICDFTMKNNQHDISQELKEKVNQYITDFCDMLEKNGKTPKDKQLLQNLKNELKRGNAYQIFDPTAVAENRSRYESCINLDVEINKSFDRIKDLIDGDIAQYKKWKQHIKSKGSFTMSAGIGPLKVTEQESSTIRTLQNQVKKSGDETDQSVDDVIRNVYERTFVPIDKALYEAKEKGRSSLVITNSGELSELGQLDENDIKHIFIGE